MPDASMAALDLADMVRSGRINDLSPQDRDVAVRIMKQLSERGVKPLWETYFPKEGPLSLHNYPKHWEHFDAGKYFNERCFMAGNRIGKTVCGGWEGRHHLTGMYPDNWPGRQFNEPVSMWACGKSNEKLYEIVNDVLFGGTRRTQSGKFVIRGTGMIESERIVHHSMRLKSGSVTGLVGSVEIRYRDSLVETSRLELKAYAQKRSAFEGTAQHVIWCDEEPPADIYSECMMRLGTKDGIMILTFTPMEGHTEVVESFMTEEMRPASISPIYTEF